MSAAEDEAHARERATCVVDRGLLLLPPPPPLTDKMANRVGDMGMDVPITRRVTSSFFLLFKILIIFRGIMKPGLNAIMGPTGCGKTS